MKVAFRKTGERRYAVTVAVDGKPAQTVDPAPGFDPLIPHDLVHYTVEAVAGHTSGVFGRAARGAGTFLVREAAVGMSARDLQRARRHQQKREASVARRDAASNGDMATSERLAAVCDLVFRRRAGQIADVLRAPPELPTSREESRIVTQVVERLEVLAPLWRALPVGAALAFTWPSLVPCSLCPEMDRWHRDVAS